jgi:hypothetical protein
MLLSLTVLLLSVFDIVACSSRQGCAEILRDIQHYGSYLVHRWRPLENLDTYFEQAIEYFYASDVYDCWSSVPFNASVARSFLDYYATTLLFQSTLAYLQSPPLDSNGTGYQQPAINIHRRLISINDSIATGAYENQYDFEADLQQMVQEMHDGHVDLTAGILSTFSFSSSYDISAASRNGIDPPQLYLTGRVYRDIRQYPLADPRRRYRIEPIRGLDTFTNYPDKRGQCDRLLAEVRQTERIWHSGAACRLEPAHVTSHP